MRRAEIKHVLLCAFASALLLPAGMVWGQEGAEEDIKLAPIEVIGTTPFEGSAVGIRHYPGAAQTADAEDIDNAAVLNFSSFLNQEFSGVHVNHAVNNPFKPDLHYRGFTASPLLGLPQGLSVYQDGVRVNEPFGDAVNFSVIPLAAIESVDLVPGSNPIFGLNTLGGALNIKTKDGFSAPGLEVKAFGGDFGRYGGHFAYGGNEGDLGWFMVGQIIDEDGWRDFSESEVRQFFGKLTMLTDNGEINFSVTAADNTLRGNGAVPVELTKREGRDAIFTYPDETSPELLFLNLRGVHNFNEDVSLAWGAYYRSSDKATFNGDGSEFEECEDPAWAGTLCIEGEDVVYNLAGNPVPFRSNFPYGTQNTSTIEQDGYGLNMQLSTPGLFEGDLVTGVAVNYASSSYASAQEIARLTNERGTVGLGVINAAAITRATTRKATYSAFFLHRMPVFAPELEWTLGGRYDYHTIEINDRSPSFAFLGPDTTSLDGDHTFKRLNLFTGLTWDVTEQVTVFGNAGQSSRAPTPMELTCANPEAPCRFPNGLVDDPPLEPVVSTTFALGVRGDTDRLDWRVALFRTVNRNAIRFLATSNRFESYFDNIDKTRHQGVEVGVDWHILPTLLLSLDYTYLDAEFRDDFRYNSPNHPVRVPDPSDPGETMPAPGTQQVQKGDRIPLMPKHIFHVGLDWQATDKLLLGVGVQGNSEQIYRGDESNTDPERIDGFVTVNAHARYQFNDNFSVFVRGINLFDEEYETFGVYGEADEVLAGASDNPRFIGPGAPRAFWAGVELQF